MAFIIIKADGLRVERQLFRYGLHGGLERTQGRTGQAGRSADQVQ